MCTKFSAVQFGGQDKPWISVAGAFVEQQHVFVIKLKVSKTGKACIKFRNFILLIGILSHTGKYYFHLC